MSKAARLAKQQELAAQQAAAYLRQREALAATPIAYAVRMAFIGTYEPPMLHAAHWVAGAVNVCLRK